MTTYAVIDDATGEIVNRIVLVQRDDWTPDEGHSVVEETDGALEIGATYENGVYTPLPVPPSPAPPVPQTISDRQFFQQLAVVGIITEDQALASNAAVIPAPLLAIIEAMPAEQQFAAKMLVSGATVFERTHPMTEAIGATYGWTSAQIDEFFRAAAVL